MFTPGTSVVFIRSTGEPALVQVVGDSFLCFVVPYSAAISVPNNVHVWSWYGSPGGWGGPSSLREGGTKGGEDVHVDPS